MDTTTIHILLVEDDEDDYLITKDLLGQINRIRFVVDWVVQPDAARERIATQSYDICLLDYRLGRHNGLELIPTFIEDGFRAPIILLTGQDDYDTDRMAMAAGASDYLIKGQIVPSSLERAIRYAIDQKRAEDALRRQSQFVSAILDTAGGLVTVLDKQGRIVRFNRACEQRTGFSADDMLGLHLWDALHPESERDATRERILGLKPEDCPLYHESHWKTYNGDSVLISWADSVLLDTSGVPEYYVCTGIDVTEERAVQAELARAREREVEVGARIQETLLVRQPPNNILGATIGTHAIPSQKIGGDYFDFFVYSPEQFDVLVGDVMGKGVPAALLAAAAKSHFQRAVRRLCLALAPYHRLPEPQEVLAAVQSELNKELVGLESYITLVYARFDLEKRSVRLVECGHPHTLRVRASRGNCEFIEGDNLPLGMCDGEVYRQTELPFETGDIFFLYSDGLTEATASDGEQFGTERLMDSLASLMDESPADICAKLCQRVMAFNSDASVLDDLTCVAVRIDDRTVIPAMVTHQFEVPSDLENLSVIRESMSDFLVKMESYGLHTDESWRDLFVLAVNEAVTNSMKHSYRTVKNGRILLELSACRDRLNLNIYDWGESFRRDEVPLPALDGSAEGGYGLYIIESAMDDVRYRRDSLGRNILSVSKRLQQT